MSDPTLKQQATVLGAQCRALQATLDAMRAEVDAYPLASGDDMTAQFRTAVSQEIQNVKTAVDALNDLLDKNFEGGGEGNAYRGRA
ncbi:MAG: hypothetical protein ABI641_12120 [Caldimonas sp.]